MTHAKWKLFIAGKKERLSKIGKKVMLITENIAYEYCWLTQNRILQPLISIDDIDHQVCNNSGYVTKKLDWYAAQHTKYASHGRKFLTIAHRHIQKVIWNPEKLLDINCLRLSE